MSDSEAVAIVQGMLAEQRKADAAWQIACLEAQKRELEMQQERDWQADMENAKVALVSVSMTFAFIFVMAVFQ